MEIRVRKIKSNFAQIANALLERNDMSWEAKGLVCYLLSKPSTWKGQKKDILSCSPKMSGYAYKKIIKELIALHIIEVKVKSSEHTKSGLGGTYYELQEINGYEYE